MSVSEMILPQTIESIRLFESIRLLRFCSVCSLACSSSILGDMRRRNIFIFLAVLHAFGAGLCYIPDGETNRTGERKSPFFPSGKAVLENVATSNAPCVEVKKIKEILNEAYAPPCCTEEVEGKIDCFVGDSEHRVLHVHIDATRDTHTYSGSTDLGGNAYSGMGCASRGEGYVDVITLTLDHRNTKRSKNPAGWDSGWSIQPGGFVFLDRPECLYSTASRLDCFNRGTQNAAYNHWAIDTAWKSNRGVGGAPLYSPFQCITRNEGEIDCFAIQRPDGLNTGLISHLGVVNTDIKPWEVIGREVQKEGTATGTKDRMDFFGLGWNNQVMQKTWTSTRGWGRWIDLGGHFLSDPKCISAAHPYKIWCFAVGIDGYKLYRNIYIDGAWSGWKEGCDTSTYRFPEAPKCFFSKRNEVSCYGRDFNARLIEIIYDA